MLRPLFHSSAPWPKAGIPACDVLLSSSHQCQGHVKTACSFIRTARSRAPSQTPLRLAPAPPRGQTLALFPLPSQQPLHVAVTKLCSSSWFPSTCPSAPNTSQLPTESFLKAENARLLAVAPGLRCRGGLPPPPQGCTAGGGRAGGRPVGELRPRTGLPSPNLRGEGGVRSALSLCAGLPPTPAQPPTSRSRSPCPPSQVISNLLPLTPQQQTTLALPPEKGGGA